MLEKKFLYVLALAAGMVLPLAFAPFNLFPIAIFSLTVLLLVWMHFNDDLTAIFLSGWLFGLGFFGVGVSWLYISIHTYGHASVFTAILTTLLFIALLALFPALIGWFLYRFDFKNSWSRNLLVFPAGWVILEWVRTWVLTGFPWLFIGYSQLNSPLKNFAPILGVYGVSFGVALLAALLALMYEDQTQPAKSRAHGHRNFAGIKIICSLAMVAIFVVGWSLGKIDWTKPIGKFVTISLVQGNIPLEVKWDEKATPTILATYKNLSADHWNSKLVVWPEGALPVFNWQISNYLHEMRQIALRKKSHLVSGMFYQQKYQSEYYNAMLALGNQNAIYLKKHLVPYGEFLPYRQYFNWLLKLVAIPYADLARGPLVQPTLKIAGLSVAPFICYEIAYPQLLLAYLPSATVLLTISEDGWFGNSIAAAQQLEIAQMRSLEAGRYQLTVANSGYTAIIDPHGILEAKIPAFQQLVLTGKVIGMTDATPWVKYGQYLWWIFAVLFIGIGFGFMSKQN